MANKTYIYCGSIDISIMNLCLSTEMPSQFEMVTLLLGHPVYEKRLLLRYIHHLKSDLINNMDHMRILRTEPSSVILSQNVVSENGK